MAELQSTKIYGDLSVSGETQFLDEVTLSVASLGLGTSDPQRELHINNATPVIRLSDTDASNETQVASWIEFYQGFDTARVGYVGYGSSVNQDLFIRNETTSGEILFYLNSVKYMTLSGAGATTSTLEVGDGYNRRGTLEIAGGPTGSTEGGELRLKISDQSNGTWDRWTIDAHQENLRIFNVNNSEAGTVRLQILTNGYVGIGTTSPSALLDLKQTGATFIELDRTDDSNIDTVFDLGVSYESSGDFIFMGPNSIDSLRVFDDGNVAIGDVDKPAYKLRVVGDAYIDSTILLNGSRDITGAPLSAAANVGWKISWFSNTFATGIANSTLFNKSTRWFSVSNDNANNDGSSDQPDTAASVSLNTINPEVWFQRNANIAYNSVSDTIDFKVL